MSSIRSVDKRDGSIVRTSARRCMLARPSPRQMFNLGSKRSGASTIPSWEAFPKPSVAQTVHEKPVIRAAMDEKASHKLHLPPFETLGIAAPHPDHFLTQSHASSALGPPRKQSFTRDTAGLGLRESTDLGNKDHRRPSRASLQMLTPPDDSGTISWNSSTTISTDSAEKDPCADIRTMASQQDLPLVSATNAGSSEGTNPPDQRDDDRGGDNGSESSELTQPHFDGGDSNGQSLIEQAISITVSGISASGNASYAVRVLSHALPCPSANSSLSAVSTFTSLITAIQTELQPSQRPYINVTHAVPSKFSLTNLPSSPPGTPNLAQGGEDYFNMTVFANAVPVHDHYDTSKVLASSPAPSSPCPIVPPASVHVALVERYIPPSSVQEYLDLSSSTGPSVLVDRLVELSPEGGSILFIYPTKRGGMTFATEYLGPILDPLLRSIVVLHKLSADVGLALGRMAAIEHMVGFETMKRKINMLLRKLNRGNGPQTSGPLAPSFKGSYNLVYSGTQEVLLDRRVWSDWWAQQENLRIRDVMSRYFKRAQRLPEDTDITSAVLVREIIDGVTTRPYGDSPAPSAGVEVGVFVIQRSL
ncbi:hypothetical protein MMC16_002899 [Acarospora aff. strigata]|nr:hypothetical protein [Acarospora aff. strigata]